MTPRLFIFDMDGTLGDTPPDNPTPFRRTPGDWAWYPGRAEALVAARRAGAALAVATNQGGPAMGHRLGRRAGASSLLIREDLSLAIVKDLVLGLHLAGWGALPGEEGVAFCYVGIAYHHPAAAVPELRAAPGDDMRKPGPGMLREALARAGVAPGEALMVGDMDTDRMAAEAAGVAYADHTAFFAGAPVPAWAAEKRAAYEARRGPRDAGGPVRAGGA